MDAKSPDGGGAHGRNRCHEDVRERVWKRSYVSMAWVSIKSSLDTSNRAKSRRLGQEPADGVRRAGRSTRSVWSSSGSPCKVRMETASDRGDGREAAALQGGVQRAARFNAGARADRNRSTMAGRGSGESSFFFRNASHNDCREESCANSSVSPIGTASGTDMPRRSKVALIAWASKSVSSVSLSSSTEPPRVLRRLLRLRMEPT